MPDDPGTWIACRTTIPTTAQITELYVCGVPTEFSVSASCRDALQFGYECRLVTDCAVGVREALVAEQLQRVERRGGVLWSSSGGSEN
jgi:nicotinamidase-related amidase